MITFLVLVIPRHTVAHEGTATILVDSTSLIVPALSACGVNITSGKPHVITFIGSTQRLSFRGPIGTVAEVLRAASRIIRNILGFVGREIHGVIKVGGTLAVLPRTA